MERKLDRKTLSFGKGMTNVPSDLLSDDTELAESNGFIYRNGEMKPVQEAKMVTGFGNNAKLMYVHKAADYKNLISYNASNELVCSIFNEEEGIVFAEKKTQYFEIDGVCDVSSVGNTLVVATTVGIYYLLFRSGEYVNLGTDIPKPNVSFYFTRKVETGELEEDRTPCVCRTFISDIQSDSGYLCYDSNGNFTGVKDNHDGAATYTLDYRHILDKNDAEKYSNFQTAVKGHAAETLMYVKKNNTFAFPFFIRTALKLYDGSYSRISNPIICYPSSLKNCKFEPCWYSSEKKTWQVIGNKVGSRGDPNFQYMMTLDYSDLMFKCDIPGKDDWQDIIKEIVFFATEDVTPFDIDADWSFKTVGEIANTTYYDGITEDGYISKELTFDWKNYQARELIYPVYKTEAKIIEGLLGRSQFYKLFSLKNNSKYIDNEWHDASAYDKSVSDVRIIKEGTVENLTSQEQLGVDDYYGWTKMVCKKLFTYNNRIHLVDAKRYPFDGFGYFVGKKYSGDDKAYVVLTHIVSMTSDTWVSGVMLASDSQLSGWLYYPDPNAKEITLYNNEEKAMRIPLTAHPLLNGAYSFENLPSKDGDAKFDDISTEEIQRIMGMRNIPENLNSQIFTSVVNNPFVFESSGDNMVGTGKILSIAANTEAVSQGQHGYAPLIVFTTEGMYALKTNSEGLYVGVDPLPREVCNNADSITPIDNYVIFTSDKGLMAATGGSAACLSEQMRGRTPRNFATMGGGRFLDFLKNCFVAYDYRDSILRIFKKSNGYTEDGDVVEDEKYYYIYDLANKTFSMGKLSLPVKAVVNDYPDNLIQDIGGYVYSLTGKPDVNDDETLYSGGFTTRPLKLGGSMTLKSIRAIKHLYDTDEGKVKLEVYASNDCKHWVRLTSLGGKPWKYFTFKYTLTDFKACDSFAGSIVEIQNRREDKIR